jgi:hypothetical protein
MEKYVVFMPSIGIYCYQAESKKDILERRKQFKKYLDLSGKYYKLKDFKLKKV